MSGTQATGRPPSSLPPGRPPAVGIVGGGQLARMTAQAASRLGCRVVVLERAADSPASLLGLETILGDWNDPAHLIALGRRCDVVTLENEFVDAGALAELERAGFPLYPSASCIARIQDKLLQKEALAAEGLPLPRFADTPDFAAAEAAAARFGYPVVLKRRRNGYDGKGNATARAPEDLAPAWAALDGDRHALFAEAWCPFERELAAMVVRSISGEETAYPVVETVQRDHICHTVTAPAQIPEPVAAEAASVARRAVAAVGGAGAFGVEMFLLPGGGIAVNELAPRVHNSGHYTIEACGCSQFENHLRAVLGWPLGSTALVAPGAAMVNLLGAGTGPGWPSGMETALAVPGAHPHVYGKAVSAKGRKMGHVTALGPTPAEALARATAAAAAIRFGDAVLS